MFHVKHCCSAAINSCFLRRIFHRLHVFAIRLFGNIKNFGGRTHFAPTGETNFRAEVTVGMFD